MTGRCLESGQLLQSGGATARGHEGRVCRAAIAQIPWFPVFSRTEQKVVSKKKASSKPGAKEPQKTCFMIMPFGGWFTPYWKSVFKPALHELQMNAERADDFYQPGSLLALLRSQIKSADVILADLTDRNPNVFYELGLAHESQIPVVMLTQNIQDVPSDILGVRLIEYDPLDPEWIPTVKSDIQKAVKEVLADPKTGIPPAFLDRSDLGDDKELMYYELQAAKKKSQTLAMQNFVRHFTVTSDSTSGRWFIHGPDDYERRQSAVSHAAELLIAGRSYSEVESEVHDIHELTPLGRRQVVDAAVSLTSRSDD